MNEKTAVRIRTAVFIGVPGNFIIAPLKANVVLHNIFASRQNKRAGSGCICYCYYAEKNKMKEATIRN
jgi:hypothetical protein